MSDKVMLSHDFVEAPGKRVEIGFNPYETVMMLRCRYCNNTPSKAREDGCAMHELQDKGCIRLDMFNPDGVEHFALRKCFTCDSPIMEHWLKMGKRDYYCFVDQDQISEGIEDARWDVPIGFGQ